MKMTNVIKAYEFLIAECDKRIAKERRELNSWIETLNLNPRHAFEWGDASFKNAAVIEVAAIFKNAAEYGMREKQELRDFHRDSRGWMMQEFFNKTDKIGGSTSYSHNLMDKFMVEAFSEFLAEHGSLSRSFNMKSLMRSAEAEMMEKTNA
jgi:hypothetical protein